MPGINELGRSLPIRGRTVHHGLFSLVPIAIHEGREGLSGPSYPEHPMRSSKGLPGWARRHDDLQCPDSSFPANSMGQSPAVQVSRRPTPTPPALLPSQPCPAGPLTVLHQKSEPQPLTGGQTAGPVHAGTPLPWAVGGGVGGGPTVLVSLPAHHCPDAQASSLFQPLPASIHVSRAAARSHCGFSKSLQLYFPAARAQQLLGQPLCSSRPHTCQGALSGPSLSSAPGKGPSPEIPEGLGPSG